mmetsp:Transcript_9898/g.12335  ORF Transcript_9898/g.12335 Transcript_9898/m.12335 type:complete len:149 (+) Transcript_9898:158-604(+)
MLHVGMNIEAKATLFREFARVLQPGGKVAVYDVMRVDSDNKSKDNTDIRFPVPWASTVENSFVESPARYKEMLEVEGLSLLEEQNRRDAVVEHMEKQRASSNSADKSASSLNLGILMGNTSIKQKLSNMINALNAGIIAPVILICQKQ